MLCTGAPRSLAALPDARFPSAGYTLVLPPLDASRLCDQPRTTEAGPAGTTGGDQVVGTPSNDPVPCRCLSDAGAPGRCSTGRWLNHKRCVEVVVTVVHEVPLRPHLHAVDQPLGIDPSPKPDGRPSNLLKEREHLRLDAIQGRRPHDMRREDLAVWTVPGERGDRERRSGVLHLPGRAGAVRSEEH